MPQIGQAVQFFTMAEKWQRPGMGAGPYAAIIVQLHEGDAADLTVFFSGDVRFFEKVPPTPRDRLTRASLSTERWQSIR